MRRPVVLLTLLALSSCASLPAEDADEVAGASDRLVHVADAPSPVEAPEREGPREPSFGLRARVPVTGEAVGGVRLVSHKVRTTVRGGFARTTVEEVWANDTPRVLEGVLGFSLPSRAAVSRLALDVDGKMVEGEIEEKKRAKQIFRAVTDYVPVPKDPALLDVAGARGELRIYPMPAGGTRRVVVAYDEVLDESAGKGRYVLPLTLGEGKGTRIGELDVEVRVEDASRVEASSDGKVAGEVVRLSGRDVAPERDLVVRYERGGGDVTRLGARAGEWGAGQGKVGPGFVGVRLRVPAAPEAPTGPVVIVVDRGHGASPRAAALAAAALSARAEAPFVVVACDAACASFPADGVASPADRERAMAWLTARPIGGAFDLSEALVQAKKRAGDVGKAVVLTRGVPSAGELAPDAIAARVKAKAPEAADVRLVATGEADGPALTRIAGLVGATMIDDRADETPRASADRFFRPALAKAALALPEGWSLAVPKALPALLSGEELHVIARVEGEPAGAVALTGELGGAATRIEVPVPSDAPEVSLLATAWARGRVADLEGAGDPLLAPQIVRLSRDFHVPSRLTSMIVLENEAMFAAFGVARTVHKGDDFSVRGGAPGAGAPSLGDSLGAAGPTGLGLSGVGEGGGGRGDGIGLGKVGTLGHGAGSSAAGFGRLSGEHAVRAPKVRMGATTVSGRLPPEVIMRIIRQRFGAFRLCLERGLREDPSASGRLAVRFAIAADGSVASAQLASSTFPVASTNQCIVNVFRGMSFPAPEGGLVTVTFPLALSPGDGDAPMPTFHAPTFQIAPTSDLAVMPGTDAWRSGGDADLARLVGARDASPLRRSAHESLLDALLRRGRAADALTAADRWVAVDRDEPKAHVRAAEVAAFAGATDRALVELSSAVALAPTRLSLVRRAAFAHASAGDAVRACAFSRAAASLPDALVSDKAEALRCRTVVLGEDDARDAAAALAEKSPLAKKLAAGERPDAEDAPETGFSVAIACNGECPAIAALLPSGRVVSRLTPMARAGATRLDLPHLGAGTYRIVWVGTPPAEPVEVTVRAPEGVRKVKTAAGVATVATIEIPQTRFGFGLR